MQTVRCGFGQVCVVQSVQCKQPPCGQQAVCIGGLQSALIKCLRVFLLILIFVLTGSSSTAGTPTVSPCAAKYAVIWCRFIGKVVTCITVLF